MGHKCWAVIPGHGGGVLNHIVTGKSRQRNAGDIISADAFGEGAIVGFDILENFLVVVHQVHLVDCDNEMADAEKSRDEGMPAGLSEHAFARIDQNNGEIGSRSACCHVAGILFMARCISHDEFALVGGESAIGHVNGNALLALGGETIDQQMRNRDCRPGFPSFWNRLPGRGVDPQTASWLHRAAADQGGLAVINGAAGDEAQEILVFLGLQIGFNIATFEFNKPATSEISFLLLLLHGGGLVLIDDAALTLGRGGDQHFLDDVEKRRGV